MVTEELVGRDPVLTALFQTLAGTGDRGDALLLVGERGIGKTACLLAARRMAQTLGHIAVETAGSEAETHLPFAGLHRLLQPLLGSADALPDVQRRALLTALGMHDGSSGDSLVVCLATMNLLAHAARHQRLLVTADDVQWLDDETRQILAFVARRLEHGRLVVIAAVPAAQGVPALADAFQEVHLDRLEESHAHRLVARRASDLDRAHRVWVVSHAAGNPLALLELAKTAASADLTNADPVNQVPFLTPPLERAFAGRVQILSGPARDAVLVAAVASDASLQEVLAATAVLRGHAVGTAIMESPQNLGLLTVNETRVQFAHPLVKAAIMQKESVSRRQAAHRALGAVITLSSYRRAWHRALGTAAHDDVVAAELEATTPDSIRRGAIPAAIVALERAAQLSSTPVERGRRLLVAARHAARLGQTEKVLRLLGAAVSGELSTFDGIRAELLREDFDGLVIADSFRVSQLCSIARRAAEAGETALALDLADAAARRRCAAPLGGPALSELTSLVADLDKACHGPRTAAVLALADPIGNGRTVLTALADVAEVSVTDGDDLTAYAVAARAVGDYATASKLFDRAEVALRARGLLGPLARNLCVAADLRLDLGEWDRAAAALVGFEALSAASMSASHRASAAATTAKIAALRGDVSTALELVCEVEHAPTARSGNRFMARAQIVRGIAYISAGKHDDAHAALSRVFDPNDPSHHFREQFDAVAYLAEAAAHTGRQDHVQDTIVAMRQFADVSGSPALMTHLAYADAVLASDDAAEELFLSALASDATGSSWPRARTQLAYGRWLRRHHRVTQSRGPLQAALTVLQRLGAVRWAAEALDELEASGAHDMDAPAVPALGLLSAQELKIAQFVARGMSNREIGQQLYLSPRTVSSHLYRIFPKLGISTRGQLAARLDAGSTRVE